LVIGAAAQMTNDQGQMTATISPQSEIGSANLAVASTPCVRESSVAKRPNSARFHVKNAEIRCYPLLKGASRVPRPGLTPSYVAGISDMQSIAFAGSC
jgi:hypothetical protein